ncbi:MAG: uroporphyrinogen decarboxylase [Bdellovibrionales bacterium]|nr:uroporphyrinogen decarboxylase [Bdellovibrionales bacterium]
MANKRFTNALARIPQEIPPIWMMRQAGRYHSHYQKLKEKYSFMELCKIPELAAETAMGPIEDFDFDISILFSDLLFPLEALGMGLTYSPGPQLEWRLSEKTIGKLLPVDDAIGAMEFQREALRATRARLPSDKSLIGFVGGPWTLFGYAVEGSHKGGLGEAKSLWHLFPRFNEIILSFLEKNIELQLDGGAEVVMVLDTAAGELSPFLFSQGVAPGIISLAKRFPGQLGYYSHHTQKAHLLPILESEVTLAGFGFDHRWELSSLFGLSQIGFIQGNFDQSLLFSRSDCFSKRLDEFLAPFLEMSPEMRAGWVCGLGHGILPATPEENVREFVRRVREVFK